MFRLGLLRETGRGGEGCADRVAALGLWRRAADQQHAGAQARLGAYYEVSGSIGYC